MKFNFRKIASALASTAMVGSTVALAAAASYPAPFVDNGAADVAVVYGSTLDMSAVSDITTSLNSALNSQSSGDTGVGSDSIMLEKSSDKFNLGDSMSSLYSTIDDGELSVLLADGVYKNDDNDDFDYEQTIVMASNELKHFLDNDFNNDEPILGFAYDNGDTILTYTLNFKPDAAEGGNAWADFVGTTIDMMGSSYYVLDASNASGGSLDLLNSADSVVLNEGETLTVGPYTVSLSFIDNTNVKLVVDGEVTPALQEDDTYQLDSGDYIGIQEILAQDYAEGTKQVEFSIGSGKIELKHGDEVKINGDDVSDDSDFELFASFVQTGAGNVNIDEFSLEWKADIDMFLGVGTDSTEFTMPGFDSVKIVLGDFNTFSEEVTTLQANGDESLQIQTVLTDGPVTLDIFYLNSTNDGIAGLGEDSEHVLATTNGTAQSINLNLDEDTYFVATWYNGDDHESYAFEIDKIDDDDDNTTDFKNLAGGTDLSISVGDTETIGEVDITLNGAWNDDDGNGTATITVSSNVYLDRIVTAEGLMMWLPVSSLEFSDTDQFINMSGIGTTAFLDANWTMHIQEEDEDGTIANGVSITSDMTLNAGDGVEVGEPIATGITFLDEDDDSDMDVAYVNGSLSTKLRHNNPTSDDNLDTLEITYFGEETSFDVFVSSSDTTSDGTSSLGDISVLDTELAASGLSGNNLIVVGGSCVNSVASDLLNGAGCGDSWTAETGLGEGDYVVETFAQSNGKVATLVAGWSQEDTASAATFLANGDDVMTDANSRYVNGALA